MEGPLRPTTGLKSEILLAHTLGYPKSWRVVRTIEEGEVSVSSGSDDDSNSENENDKPSHYRYISDTIYAGDPALGVDGYCNHAAATDAALRWIDDKSNGFNDDGGQMLERSARYEKGDTVEVLYEADETWYDAEVVRVVLYEDDVRYTVLFIDEDTTQSNVSEELMKRSTKKKKTKKNAGKVKEKNRRKGKNVGGAGAKKDSKANVLAKKASTGGSKKKANKGKKVLTVGMNKGNNQRNGSSAKSKKIATGKNLIKPKKVKKKSKKTSSNKRKLSMTTGEMKKKKTKILTVKGKKKGLENQRDDSDTETREEDDSTTDNDEASLKEEDSDDDIEEEEETIIPTTKMAAKKVKISAKAGSKSYIPDPIGLVLAAEMGLPDGWTARRGNNSKYTFYGPGGVPRLQSKKALNDHLGYNPALKMTESTIKRPSETKLEPGTETDSASETEVTPRKQRGKLSKGNNKRQNQQQQKGQRQITTFMKKKEQGRKPQSQQKLNKTSKKDLGNVSKTKAVRAKVKDCEKGKVLLTCASSSDTDTDADARTSNSTSNPYPVHPAADSQSSPVTATNAGRKSQGSDSDPILDNDSVSLSSSSSSRSSPTEEETPITEVMDVIIEDYKEKKVTKKKKRKNIRHANQNIKDADKESGGEESAIGEDEENNTAITVQKRKRNRLSLSSPFEGPGRTEKKESSLALTRVTEIPTPKSGGDPPWRTIGHKYLGLRILYPTPPAVLTDEAMDGVVDVHNSRGTVAGWISSRDVDNDGAPGFESIRTGNLIQADLFHVVFDDSSILDYQDLEEYELMECLVDKDDSNDDDHGRRNMAGVKGLSTIQMKEIKIKENGCMIKAGVIDNSDDNTDNDDYNDNDTERVKDSDKTTEEDEDDIPLAEMAKKNKN